MAIFPHRTITLSLLFLLVFSFTIHAVFATPTTSPYLPGETLDPSCVPGSTKCYVDPLPDQTSNSGKFLTTNGTAASWANIATNGSMFGNGSAASPLGVLGISASDDNVLAVTVATTAALPGSPVYANGAGGVGATLTRGTNGALPTIDGVTLAVNDRILVKDQASTLQNGIYKVTSLGSASTKYVLTRTTDSDSTSEFQDQIAAPAMGTVGAGTLFSQNTDNPTVGTNPIVYAQVTGRYVTQKNSGTQTSGQIPFWTTKGRQLSKGTTDLFWDNTDSRLGVLDGTPDFTLDVGDASGVLNGSLNFSGSGLDDMTEDPLGFNSGSSNTYIVSIDTEGTPDTFDWADSASGFTFTFGVPITGSAQTLSNGVTITFGATTGHTAGESWDWQVDPSGGDAVINVAGSYYTNGVFFAQQDTNNLNLQIGDTGSGPSTFSGIDNTIVGMQAGAGTGSTNSIFGLGAGNATMSGSSNNLFGYLAGNGLTSGANNILIGNSAGASLSSGTQNVAIGSSAGASMTNASALNNVFVGYGAGASNTTGARNLFIGGGGSANPTIGAGGSNTTANANTYVGAGSGALTAGTANGNTFFGANTGAVNTAGIENTFVGTAAGGASITDSNTYVGFAAGQFTTTASANTFLGWKAGRNNNGSRNTYLALGATTLSGGAGSATGADNTAVGYLSAESITTGLENTFVGSGAGNLVTSGKNNVLLGSAAGNVLTTGDSNIVIGSYNSGGIGPLLSTGASNIFVGFNAGRNITTGSTNIIIGTSNSAVSATASNQLDIGDAIYGDLSTGNIGLGDSSPAALFTVGNGDLFQVSSSGIITAAAGVTSSGTITFSSLASLAADGYICYNTTSKVLSYNTTACGASSMNFKHDIESLDVVDTLSQVMALRPVSYALNSNGEHNVGFIAEEVASVEPRLLTYEADGTTIHGLNYAQFAPLLAGAIQELDLKLEPITSLALNTSGSLANLIKTYLEDALNGLTKIFVGEVHTDKLCVGDTCVTESQLQELLNAQGGGNTGNNNNGGGDGGSDTGNGGNGGDNGGSSDTTDPVITLLGDNPMTVNQGDTFTDPGATATDDIDGDVTASIQTEGSVDTATAGTYTIKYRATDAAGNHGHAERNVTVIAQTNGGETL